MEIGKFSVWLQKIKNDDLSKVLDLTKLCLYVCGGLGAIYLFFYCLEEGVPYPLSIKELMSALVVIFLVSSYLVLGMTVLSLLPAFSRLPPFGERYRSFYVTAGNNRMKAFCIYMDITGLPLLGLMSLFTWYATDGVALESFTICTLMISGHAFLFLLACLTVLVGLGRLFVRGSRHFGGKNLRDVLKAGESRVLAGLVLACFMWFLWMTIPAIKLGSPFLPVSNEWQVVILLVWCVVLAIANFCLVVPSSKPGSPLVLPRTMAVIGIMLAAIPLAPIFSTKICAMVLAGLRAGGAIEVVYGLDKTKAQSINDRILEDSGIRTKKLCLILDLGSRAYVRERPDAGGTIYAIDKAAIVSEEFGVRRCGQEVTRVETSGPGKSGA
jgi:hypothetical protein